MNALLLEEKVVIKLPPITQMEPLELSSSSDSEVDYEVERVVCVSPNLLVKAEISTTQLISFLHENVRELVSLPYEKDTLKTSKDTVNYIMTYNAEVDAIKPILLTYEPSLCRYNNIALDRLLWLSGETIKRFLLSKNL